MRSKIIVFIFIFMLSEALAKFNETCNNGTCLQDTLKSMLSDLENYRPVTLISGITLQIEKTVVQDKIKDIGNTRKGKMISYLTNHALKLDLGVFTLRLARSKDYPDKLEMAVYLPGNENDARKKSGKILLPMIIGFKAASVLVVAIIGVALITFKALLIAKLALSAVIGVGMKKWLDDSPQHKYVDTDLYKEHEPLIMSNVAYDIPVASAYSGLTGYEGYSNINALSGHGVAESVLNPSFVTSPALSAIAMPNDNATVHQAATTAAKRRRDSVRRRRIYTKPNIYKSSTITFRKVSSP